MKRRIVFSLGLLACLIWALVLPAKAQPSTPISLEQANVILSDSDVELVSSEGGGAIYALVNLDDEYCLFLSENEGRSWQKAYGGGLPEEGEFVSLETLADQPETVVLATKDSVYLSQDSGQYFRHLGLPEDLMERGEEITSLAISDGDFPEILIGIWHPDQEKFPREGVYLWRLEGKHSWEGQGMRPTWPDQGKGYLADVTSVAFLGLVILAVATGDPDGLGSMPEGTYLNMGYLSQGSPSTTEWNWPSLFGWPIEIAEGSGLSPTEEEILSSRIVFPDGLEFDDPEELIFYVLYNTRDRIKDGVYKVEDTIVRELELPRYSGAMRLDDLDYSGKTLAVGVTNEEGVQILCLNSNEERLDPPEWSVRRMKAPDVRNCQIAFSSVFSENGVIFAATSGENSSFARSKEKVLIPISLMDISGEIAQLSSSPRFSTDRTLFLNYGEENILKVVLGRDYRLRGAERILLVPDSFQPEKIKIEPLSDSLIFVFERGTDQFWLTENGGSSWLTRTIPAANIVDAEVLEDETVWAAGEDGSLYHSDKGGKSWQSGLTSGIRWLQKIELGPEEKILAVGSQNEEDVLDTISLGNAQRLDVVLRLEDSTDYLEAVFALQEGIILLGAEEKLHQLAGNKWREIAEFERDIDRLLVSSQGLYVFCEPYLHFSSFPLNSDSQWETIEFEEEWTDCIVAKTRGKDDLLFFWNASEITYLLHRVPEEEPEKEVPLEPDKSEPESVESVSAEPEKTDTSKPAEPAISEPAESESAETAKPETTESSPAEGSLPPKPPPEEPGGDWIVPTLIALNIIELAIIVGLLIYIRRIPY